MSNLIGKLENIATADVQLALAECAVKVRDDAKELCPANTGELEKSIDWMFVDDYTVAVGTNKYYAPYVEIGTGIYAGTGDAQALYPQYIGTGRQTPWTYYDEVTGRFYTTLGHPGRPFVLPALLQNENFIKERLGAEIKIEVEK